MVLKLSIGLQFLSFVFVFAVLLAFPSHLRGQELDRSTGLRKIRPNCYVYLHGDDTPGVSSTFNNGIIVTSEGVLVIDTQRTEVIARQVRESISGVTSQPIRFLIISSFHNPFTGGMSVYSDAFRISQENCRADFLNLLKNVPAEERIKKLPHETYRERVTLYLGGKEIQILYLGRAHTRGDSIVFLPEERLAYLSEIFYLDEFPYISEGYSADWIRTLEAAEGLKADIFIPGHGFLPRDIKETQIWLRRQRQILEELRQAVREQVNRGASIERAVNTIDLPQFKKFKGYQRALEIAVRRIYRELTVGLP